jgi:exosortase
MARAARLAVIVGVAALLAPSLWHLADVGRTNEYAGHAMFVPLFAALIAWSDRDRLRALARSRGPVAGAVVLALGVAAALAGRASDNDVLQALGVTAAVAGVVLWLFGTACLRAAAFPVAFLVMLAPLPRPVVAAVTDQLQHFAAGFAAGALRVAGIPVFHVGDHLELATMSLQVAEVCNGLRFLMAIIVLTAAFAAIMMPSWQRGVVLVSSAAPIAIIANAVRVAAIAIGVHYFGPDAASGTIHNWIGKGVWAVTLVPLVVLGVALARGGRSRRDADGFAAVPAGKTETA